jgi:superfamily II DNA or RNA helicase
MTPMQPKQQKMRRWQIEAALAYAEANAWHFLARVTPGGGKTYWALRIAQAELCQGTVERIVLVVPTRPIKEQWIEETAKRLGFKLVDYDAFEAGGIGYITTYQQLAGEAAENFRAYCKEFKVFAIFDEVHHASDRNTWGERLRYAFSGAGRILSLTGTPFRSDGRPVPFVRYEKDLCQPDFSFVYPQALADNIVRSLRFVFYDGSARWQRDGEPPEEGQVSVAGEESPETLRAALEPSGDFARAMIQGAHTELIQMPPGSAGLLVAKDTEHANQLACLLAEVTGRQPVVVHTASAGSKRKIKAFRNSDEPWIVSVRMVSEGVDFPRVRVICWMTNYKTQLYFEQLIARGLRGPAAEECVVVMPELPSLVAMSYAVTHAAIPSLAKKLDSGKDDEPGGQRTISDIKFLGSEGYLSRTFTPSEPTSDTDDPIAISCLSRRKDKSDKEMARYHSDEAHRQRVLARASSEEYLQRSSQSRRNRYKDDPEYRKKVSGRNSRRREDPAFVQRNIEYQKSLRESAEYRASMSKAMTDKYHADPSYRQKKLDYEKKRYQAKKLAQQQRGPISND